VAVWQVAVCRLWKAVEQAVGGVKPVLFTGGAATFFCVLRVKSVWLVVMVEGGGRRRE
jgi:hypothetical protein